MNFKEVMIIKTILIIILLIVITIQMIVITTIKVIIVQCNRLNSKNSLN